MDLKSREGRREQGELIKAAATAAGLTLRELATRLGVSHALIYQYVSGANLAQPDKLQEIAQLTGVPVGYFFGEPAPGAAAATALSPSGQEAPHAGEPPRPAEAGVDSARLQQTFRQLEQLARAQDLASRDLPGLLRTLDQMLGLTRLTGDQRQQTELLLRIGNARTDAGELQGASEALEECVALGRELGLTDRMLSAMQSLARCRSLTGQTAEAEVLFREVAGALNPDLAWRGLLGLGQVHEQRDHYEEALADFTRARDVLETLPASAADTRSIAEVYVRTNVANVYMAEGDFQSAVPLWQENLGQTEELSQPDQFLEALLSEAMCHLHLGRPGLAHDLCHRAVRLSRLLGDRERLAVSRACLADVFTLAGLFAESREQAREAGSLASEIGTTRGSSLAHLALARSLVLSSQGENALFYLDQEMRSPYPRIAATALLLRADLARRDGRYDEAGQDARTALDTLRNRGALYLERAAWTTLAQLSVLRSGGAGDLSIDDEAFGQAVALERFTPGLPDTSWTLEAATGARAHLRGEDAAPEYYGRAVTLIQGLRSDLASHGVLETCLDDPEKLRVYREAIAVMRAAGRESQANAIIAEANWPPLTEEN